MLCRAISCPTDELLAAAQRVLMYLSHHRAIELRFSKARLPVSGFSDSDRATRHSTSGYVLMYNRAAIFWASKKQPSVALSSCEAEIAASEATKEALYLRSLFADLGLAPCEPTLLALDNKSAIDFIFFVRERVESLDITVPFVKSADNLANFFTKPLPPRVFFAMRDTIMNVPH
eukprot:3461011-Pleurochrysis_carterae.AAC.2